MKQARSPGESANTSTVIAVVSSAGGIKALVEMVEGLGKDFEPTILIVQHLFPHGESHLPEILGRHYPGQVMRPEPGSRLRPGVLYIAPPDHHMTLEGEAIRLDQSQKVHNLRPSGDRLFMSVAASAGSRAIGVVLSGTGSDGTAGCVEIASKGGTVIVQDAASAEFETMPRSALDACPTALVMKPHEIASFIRERRETARDEPPQQSR